MSEIERRIQERRAAQQQHASAELDVSDAIEKEYKRLAGEVIELLRSHDIEPVPIKTTVYYEEEVRRKDSFFSRGTIKKERRQKEKTVGHGWLIAEDGYSHEYGYTPNLVYLATDGRVGTTESLTITGIYKGQNMTPQSAIETLQSDAVIRDLGQLLDDKNDGFIIRRLKAVNALNYR